MTSTAITNIGELVTNDPELGAGLLGIVPDAGLVVEGRRVVWVGPAVDLPATDTVVDAGGRAVLPGFVDSHSHLVFAGDRAPEFAARMAGEAYAAGGIRTTVAATRAATDEQLTSHVGRLVQEMQRQGTTTVEIKSGYGLTVRDGGPEPGRRPAVHRGDHLPRRPRRPGRARRRPGRLRRPGHRADARGGCAVRPLDRRLLRGGCLRRRPGARRAGRRCGVRAAGTAARQPARPRPRRTPGRRARPGRCRPLHLPDRHRRRRAARVGHGRHAAARRGVLDPAPYPDARALVDAGVQVALASDCNPGSSYTSSVPFCIALAVREMGLTPAEAVHAATAQGARAPLRDDVGRLAPEARADLVLLDAPSHVHLAYRPGVPLVAATWIGGRPV